MDSSKGHDTYVISKKCWHTYYILDGEGTFEINNVECNVHNGMVVEIPPNSEFSYTGKMKLLLIMNPPYFKECVEVIRNNTKVK